MDDSTAQSDQIIEEEAAAAVEAEHNQLRHLKFVPEVTAQLLMWAASLYLYHKCRAGALISVLQFMEDKVCAVAGPLYRNLAGDLLHLLKFADRKIEELEPWVPSIVKEATTLALVAAIGVWRSGLIRSTIKMACLAYYLHQSKVRQGTKKTFRWACRCIPLFARLFYLLLPVAIFYFRVYNRMLRALMDRHVPFAAYLPFVPCGRITRFFAAEDSHDKAE